MPPMSQWKASNCFTHWRKHAKQKIRDNKQIQAQKERHANSIILKSCDTTVLKTLPLVVQCNVMFADECASTKLLVQESLRFWS